MFHLLCSNPECLICEYLRYWMSDTPRTDAIVYRDAPMSKNDSDIVDLCHQLERELTRANSALEVYRAIEHDRNTHNAE
jgi:hypothetical protein